MSQQPLAYLYPEFLESPEARPIRILSEYLEPLRRFKEAKIQDTVVFFGSARVDSRERAERALRTLRAGFPEAHLGLGVADGNVSLLPAIAGIDSAIVFGRGRGFAPWQQVIAPSLPASAARPSRKSTARPGIA